MRVEVIRRAGSRLLDASYPGYANYRAVKSFGCSIGTVL